jgi:hypothetical protein
LGHDPIRQQRHDRSRWVDHRDLNPDQRGGRGRGDVSQPGGRRLLLRHDLQVTAVVGDTFTIVRAQEGTQALAWNPGDTFSNLITAGALAGFLQGVAAVPDTAMIYAGIDTSTVPSTIICDTVPVPPAGLEIGMQFNIKVANTNTGPVTVILNGGPGIQATRTDTSPMVGGNLSAGEEMIFVFNGTTLSTMVPSIPAEPPSDIFYVRTDGNDANSGFENTAQEAFRTVQGGMNAIQERYISQHTIYLLVEDGMYGSGFAATSPYIGNWAVIGNPNNPGNCIINATSTDAASYVPGCSPGHCVAAYGNGNMTVDGFTFQSYYSNLAASGGYLSCGDCHYTGALSGLESAINCAGGNINLWGNNTYTPSGPTEPALMSAGEDSGINMGYTDIYWNQTFSMNLLGAAPTFTGATAISHSGSVIVIFTDVCVFTGAIPNNAEYICQTGGGIQFNGPNKNIFPGTSPGIVTPPGWIQ